MIEGMTILSYGSRSTFAIFMVFVCLFFCAVLGLCVCFSKEHKDVFGISLLLCMGVIGITMTVSEPSYLIVEATVSETASWSEISQRYKLIEKRGEIHVFKVLEEDKKDMEADSDCECKCNCRK